MNRLPEPRTLVADGYNPFVVHARLSVGLTGHRLDRLGTLDLEELGASIDAILRAIEAATPALSGKDRRLVTGLAEGADSIAADRAISGGWRIDAALPFFRDEFAVDFAPGTTREAYYRRLAACGAVTELPGDRTHPDDSGIAYERAGHLILAQSDVLIAIWDGLPARGRGGAAAIVAEAVLRGLPVIHLHPRGELPPALLWDGLQELDLDKQSVETVARRHLSALPEVLARLFEEPGEEAERLMLAEFGTRRFRRWTAALAYPLLLAVAGARRPRIADIHDRSDNAAAAAMQNACSAAAFGNRIETVLAPRFAHADTIATRSAQQFRSGYVANFGLAALAVLLSLAGLALPGIKPLLLVLELGAIFLILLQTRTGNRSGWHRLWLNHRTLAERLRCLAISAQLGDPGRLAADAHTPAWVSVYLRATARELGLPNACIDETYLKAVRSDLLRLLDNQIVYLAADARRMHHVEHRLHRLGILLFGLTAVACVAMLGFEIVATLVDRLEPLVHTVAIAATIVGAALPAVGAAIYGMRMQGDFAGLAERNKTLADQLRLLRTIIANEPLVYDTLGRRVERTAQLLCEHLVSWLQTYHARPLTLPG